MGKSNKSPIRIFKDPYLSLAGAVIVRAVDDAKDGDQAAHDWLMDIGFTWLEKLGADVSLDYFERMIKPGEEMEHGKMSKNKQGKIEALRARYEELKQAEGAVRLEQDRIGQEGRHISSRIRSSQTPAEEIPGLKVELRRLEERYATLVPAYEQNCKLAHNALIDLNGAERRLRDAQETIEQIRNPPPWGLGDLSLYDISQRQARAEQVIRELVG